MYHMERMKDFLVIRDPEVAKIFADPCRRSILHNLRHYEMTPYQLSKALGKNVSSITHHLSVLEKNGLIEQTRSQVKGNLIERFYRATAKKFLISYTLSEGLVPGSEDIARRSKEIYKSAVTNMGAFGYDIPKEKVNKLLKLVEKYSSLNEVAYEEVISKQTAPVHADHVALSRLVSLLRDVRLYKNPDFLKTLDKLATKLGCFEKKNTPEG